MSRKLQASLSVLSTAVLLAGCSTTSDLLESKKIDYKSVSKERTSTLEVPPDLTLPSRDDRYAVPDVTPKGTATFSSYAADRVGVPKASTGSAEILPDMGNIRVERDGNTRWLVVPVAPEKLWPQVKEFWQDSGFVISTELPEAGIMETDWAENRAKIPGGVIRDFLSKALDTLYSTAERDKFRTRLERGGQAGTTEVYVSGRSMQEVFINEGKDQTRWEPKAPDPGMEAEMLRRLMVRLGVDEVRSKTLMAGAVPQPDRVKLNSGPDGAGVLRMDEAFDRAWRRVGLALDRVGFTVEDRDRSKGIYYVRYVDPEADAGKDDSGLLSKLAFWRSSKDGKATKAQYRIYVKADGLNASSVQVLSTEGGADNSDSSRKILGLLYQQLR